MYINHLQSIRDLPLKSQTSSFPYSAEAPNARPMSRAAIAFLTLFTTLAPLAACTSDPADTTQLAADTQDSDPARARHQRSYTRFPHIGKNANTQAVGTTFRPLNPNIDAATAGPELDIPARTTDAKAWSIVLATFPANVSIEELNAALNMAAVMGIRDAYPDRRGSSIAVAYGMFARGDDPAAREALNQVQRLEVEGRRPFATAILVPPPLTSVEGSLPDYDLGTVRARVADAAFTLQVAVYKRTDNKAATDADLAQFRKAAEQAVMEYRRQGEEAYYYHTARASTVTIGVFTEDDYSGRQIRPDGRVTTGAPVPSPALAELIKKFPHTLVNGQGLALGSNNQRLQPSMVVEIPR